MYNVENYIEECLMSVSEQTYRNLEIIVINDGSTDNSRLIAERYSEKDSRIKIYNFKNAGLSEARNRGLRVAKGDYVAFLDSDDWIEKDMYSILVSNMLKYNLDMIKCSVCEFNYKVKKMIVPKNKTVKNKCDVGGEQGDLLKRHYFSDFLWKIACNAVYTRELALKVLFPKGLCFEDNYSAGMYLFYSSKVMVIDKVLYNYRVNLSGISKSGNKRPLDIAVVTKKLIVDLVICGFNDNVFMNKLYEKLACEIFHFIRAGKDKRFKIIKVDNSLYKWLCKNLNLRRRLYLKFLLLRYGIRVE